MRAKCTGKPVPFHVGVFLCVSLLSAAVSAQTITYTLAMPEPWTHCFRVSVHVDGLAAERGEIDLRLPAWRSGRYEVLDFAGGVVQFAAFAGRGSALKWQKVDKNTWRIAKGKERSIRAEYTVYADEFGNRTRGLNARHGFVDGTAVFMYLVGAQMRPVDLKVEPYPGWRVSTALPPAGNSGLLFRAPSYEVLADSPIEIGTHREIPFVVEGKPHRLAVYGNYDVNLDTLVGDIAWIVKSHADFWGGLPYERYLFILHAIEDGGGGTEHANSCVLGVAPVISRTPVVSHDLQGLVSHEFFHVWNVKRFRPKGMNPYDWRGESYFRELWLVEGGTSYAHGRVLQGSRGVAMATIEGIAEWIRADRLRPGGRMQSLAESSFDAWIKYWKRSPESFNYEVDLYWRGAMMCGLMDLEIRHRSQNRHSFDDLLRTLYRRFPAEGEGYTVEDVEAVAGELAGSSMKEFFARYISGTETPDWPRFLGYAGLVLEQGDGIARPWWGVSASSGSGPAVIGAVVRGSAADAARLQRGDEIVALDGVRVTGESLQARVLAYGLGDTIRVTLFREGMLTEIPVPLTVALPPAPRIRKSAEAGEEQRALFTSWTGTAW